MARYTGPMTRKSRRLGVDLVGGDAAFEDIAAELADALRAALADGAEDAYDLQQLMRRRLGRWVNKTHRRRPMIVPVVIAT